MSRDEVINAYFKLRKESPLLRELGVHFEGLPWRAQEDVLHRSTKDGWYLSVYEFEDEPGVVEAIVHLPDGTHRSFA